MSDSPRADLPVPFAVPGSPLLLDGNLRLGLQQIAADQGHECHRHDLRGNQRTRDHDGQAIHEFAGVPRQHQERQVSDDIRQRCVHHRREQLCRSQPCGDRVRVSLPHRALDRIAGDYRHVHQQPERDDQGGDGNLLQIDPEDVRHAERQRERNRDRQRHENRGTPAPEPEPGDYDDQDDRLPEARHEQVDVLRHLPGLIGGSGENQVSGQLPFHLFHSGRRPACRM